MSLRLFNRACHSTGRHSLCWGNPMRSRTGIAACAAAAVWLFGLVRFASAEPVIFDSLGGANSGAANTSIDPVISGPFRTGGFPLRVTFPPVVLVVFF